MPRLLAAVMDRRRFYERAHFESAQRRGGQAVRKNLRVMLLALAA
jgi:hypothetical protein